MPLEDPNLPFALSERFYPVRGATIEQLVPQTYHVQDEWAAYCALEHQLAVPVAGDGDLVRGHVRER